MRLSILAMKLNSFRSTIGKSQRYRNYWQLFDGASSQMRLIPVSLIFISSACALSSCATSSTVKPTENIGLQSEFQRSLLEEETSRGGNEDFKIPAASDAQYNFLRGQMALVDEDYGSALTFFKEAARLEQKPAPTLRKSLAQLYVRMGKVDEALQEVDKALFESPADLELLQLRAGILATQKKTKEAIEAYKKIIAVNPAEHEDDYVLIASLYAQEGNFEGAREILKDLLSKNAQSFFGNYYLARMSEATGDNATAEQYYKKALQLNPDVDSVSLDLARVYGAQKRFAEAIQVVEAIVKQNPKNIAARNLLAQLLMGDNRVDKALQEFETVGTLESDPTNTRLKIALIKLQRRDLEGAVTELNLVLAEHPQNATAHYYLSSAYAGLKRVSDALQEIKKISPTDEYFGESRILGALMLQQEKRSREGVELLNGALEVKKDDVKILSLKATLQHEAGDIEGAAKTASQVVALEPTKDKNYFTLGVLLDELGKKDEAIQAMRKAIEIDPKNANALNYLGYTLVERKENLEEAESLIRRAIEIEKNNGYFIDSLGWYYYQQGRYKDAARELEQAVKFVPTDAVILEHYALALIRIDNKKKALEVVNKALQHTAESDDKHVEERLRKLADELK